MPRDSQPPPIDSFLVPPRRPRVPCAGIFPLLLTNHYPLSTTHCLFPAVTPLESAHPGLRSVTPVESALPKSLDLKPSRIRTYEKNREARVLLLTRHPLNGVRPTCVSRPAHPKPQPDREDRKQCPASINHGVVGRRLPAGDKELVDFVQGPISGCNGERRKAPSPAPTPAAATHAPVDRQGENKIFRDMRHLADDVMNHRELRLGNRGKQPAQDGFDDARSMLRGKGIRGHDENEAGPRDGGPPGAQPAQFLSVAKARLNLLQLRRGTRIAPRVRHRSARRWNRVGGSDSCAVIPSGNWAPRA